MPRPEASKALPPLSGIRVLDLSDTFGLLAGQILADLGADVIQVEPPGGARARRRGPFVTGADDPESSLHWWAGARGKRSIVLDLDDPHGCEALRDLAHRADVLIESAPVGWMGERGLGMSDLEKIAPGLVYVSITPYGQTGPKAGWKATDLTLFAAAGPLVMYGDDDRPPVRVTVPQSDLHGAVDAVVGTLIALHERLGSGRGQHVDVSIQQSVTAATQSSVLSSFAGDAPLERMAGGSRVGPLETRFLYPARDGYVSITHVFGSAIGPLIRKLMEYIHEKGGCDEATRDKDWVDYLGLLLRGEEPWEEFERVKQVIADFTGARDRAHLGAEALERGLLLAPIVQTDGVVANEHFRGRGYWREVAHEDLGRAVEYPGPFARFGRSPVFTDRRAPRIDEHRAEILTENGTTPVRTGTLTATPPARALEGVKVLDLMWVIAGPRVTRILADYGATVVRLESTTRTDAARTLRPFRNGEPDRENSFLFHSINAGKNMMTLDLKNETGREIFLDLVRWADVVCESFSPGTMKSWGLDYPVLKETNPEVIMMSSCLMGQSGPHSTFAGFGNLAAAITGFYDLTGWPDRAPAGPWGAYTDYVVPRYGAMAILAALEHRRRTGEGQYIDLAQAEAALHFLAPALLDQTVNGSVQTRAGNDDPHMAPHGVFPSAGDDQWIAVAVENDEQWGALAALIGLAEDERLRTFDGRLGHREEIERRVSDWTSVRDPFDAERELQAAGIPAAAVQRSADLARDPQLQHRGHFVEMDSPEPSVIEGSRFSLSRTPAQVGGSLPTLGRDNQTVLEEILGYDDERILEIVLSGALE